MFKALRNNSIRLLWSGQALSAIGDEIYRVAFVWLAVGMIGADTGYLVASQAAALLLLSLIGGKWADRWDHLRTMIWVDSLRGLIVLAPVILFRFFPVSLPVLLVVALLIAALSAFFDPAMQASLPGFSPNREILQAANGIMATTLRLARVVGPGIIGVLTAIIPTVHFFTIDALTFFVSAFSILLLTKHPRYGQTEAKLDTSISFKETLVSGYRVVRESRVITYVMLMKAIGGGAWNLAYSLGLAMRTRQLAADNVRAFGWVIAAYGVGNLSSALILGNCVRKRPASLVYLGHVWMGIGFVSMGMAPNLSSLMLASAFCAAGGPFNDIPMVDLVQSRYSVMELPKIFRLRMALETAATLVGMLISPWLFRQISVQAAIALSGFIIFFLGALGFLHFNEEESRWNERPFSTV